MFGFSLILLLLNNNSETDRLIRRHLKPFKNDPFHQLWMICPEKCNLWGQESRWRVPDRKGLRDTWGPTRVKSYCQTVEEKVDPRCVSVPHRFPLNNSRVIFLTDAFLQGRLGRSRALYSIYMPILYTEDFSLFF